MEWLRVLDMKVLDREVLNMRRFRACSKSSASVGPQKSWIPAVLEGSVGSADEEGE